MPMIRELNEKFFDEWSSEMAYVLGFIFADGSIFTNPRGSEYLDISSTDFELMKKIKQLLESSHKISTRKARNDTQKDGYKLQIGSKHMILQLKKLGIIPRKSLIMEFPNIPESFVLDFVRGYFDGDGCVSFGKYWRKDSGQWKWQLHTRFTSGSKKFLTRLWKELRPYTQGGFIYKKTNNSGFELVFSRHDSMNLFKFMYNKPLEQTFLKRKYISFQKAFKYLSNAGVA